MTTEPAAVESEADPARAVVAAMGGDPWAALRALLAYNEALERALEQRDALISGGYVRRSPSAAAPAAAEH